MDLGSVVVSYGVGMSSQRNLLATRWLIPDPLGDPSPSSNRKLLVGADIFNGSGISPKEKLGKKYIYIICQVSSGRVGPAVFKLDNGSGIL